MRRYLPQPLQLNQSITLSDEDYNYIVRVLRHRVGDQIQLFNGQGGAYLAEITAIEKRTLTLLIIKFLPENRTSTITIHLYQSLAKGNRLEWIMQKATELGVTSITPLITERSVMQLNRRQLPKRLERWRSIIYSAAEQSGLNIPPQLNEPCPLDSLEKEKIQGQSIILSPLAKQSFATVVQTDSTQTYSLFIGPEGGWTQMEENYLVTLGAKRATLGARILRTETAALSVIASLHGLLGDWA